jgi:SpoVK/Ycf46/Vps4 family AAA+-type ATPase
MAPTKRKDPPADDEDDNFDASSYNINSIKDLIDMTMDYCRKAVPRSKKGILKLHKLPLILDDICQLNEMVGLEKLKNQVLHQILYYLEDNDKMLMHTVIEGPPGCGKTTVAKIMGSIYSKLGLLKKEKFKILGRADLIGEYLGETTQKTIEALDSCKNGVAFIDEAYSLGNGDSRSDSYSKEAIDTLNQYLLENKDTFICIIAGYKRELEECFFSKNPGLRRRFPWVFTIDHYTIENLTDIFYGKLGKWKLSIEKLELVPIFKKHASVLKNNGGDIEIILQFAKMHHIKKNFAKKKTHVLDLDDLNYAINELVLSRETKADILPFGMYA